MSETIEIKVPPLGESVVEATVANLLKNNGDFVDADETIMELETDKVTLEVSAPASGNLDGLAVKEGDTVQVDAFLASLKTGEKAAASVDADSNAPAEDVLSSSNGGKTSAEVFGEKQNSSASLKSNGAAHEPLPSAKKMIADKGIDASSITGTAKNGRVSKGDVLSFLSDKGLNPSERLEIRKPLSRLRQRIAERLKDAQNTAAMLTTFNEVDMSSVMALRNSYKDAFIKAHDVKLGFMSFFVKATTQALKEIPMVNARIEGDEIVYNNYCDIGVAVSSPKGLVVPVLRSAETMSLATVEKSIADYGVKARDGKLTMEDMAGGTFTISNGGVFGSMLSTPILNPPQSGILGMHSIQERPVAVKGRVEIRPMMYLALSYDHRIVDGREAVTFLKTIKECLENPGRFILDL